jgi:hypothetical protein
MSSATGSRFLPQLEKVGIASPCSESWKDMVGDDRVRFCGKCEKNVFNLSAMTREEADALLEQREGKICVRFYRRADGKLLTSDCPVGVQRKRATGVAAVAAGLVAALAPGCYREPMMGEPPPPPPPPPGYVQGYPTSSQGYASFPYATSSAACDLPPPPSPPASASSPVPPSPPSPSASSSPAPRR